MPWQSDPIVQPASGPAFWERDPTVEPPSEEPPKSKTEQVMRKLGLAARSVGRQLGLTARAGIEGVADVLDPFASSLAYTMNLGLRGADALIPGDQSFRFPQQSEAVSGLLTQAGLPEPANAAERAANIAGRFVTSIGAGSPLTSAAAARLGVPPRVPNAPTAPRQVRTSTPAAQTLQRQGIPLDRSQRTGNRFAQMLRSAVTNHPMTAERQAAFSQAQQKAFNRAVLRSIGADADEATQGVMNAARSRIGAVFDRIGKGGAVYDDVLEAQIASIVDDATRTVPQSELAPLTRNIDDLLNAVDESGKINGDVFIRVRSRLSNLARRPGIGEAARNLEDALLDALERTHPGQREALQDAATQWRNMRIIQGAIAKGAERDISPLALSNALGTRANQSMSVFGLGGDQGLVELAQAGRTVLPQALPDSGTVPRGLMQAPIRAIATAPLYRGVQNFLLSQPSAAQPAVTRNALVPASGVILQNALQE